MATAIVTGSGGLIGSETTRRLVEEGFEVVGIENDTRAELFGSEASTAHVTESLAGELDAFRLLDADIRDTDAIEQEFAKGKGNIELVVHTAAQPSHDWAASDPPADSRAGQSRESSPRTRRRMSAAFADRSVKKSVSTISRTAASLRL